MNLDRVYQGQGVSFRYPANWELAEEPREDALTLSVSEGAAFWSITILRRRPRAERVVKEAIQAFREEYDDLDEYPAAATLVGETAVGRNLEFVALELINCVFMRALETGGRTLFVLAQVTDHERDEYEPVFDAISESLTIAPDDEILLS
ncbi:hypothetical protein [Planctomicrobium piriforme]|uniref:DUF1795 domain-containing protein n=1 Tax=Planctomicrobium piriforme TaxID=1576369 RepID=A0A1I3DLB7_9PLAN|nr:hypothetical protein [Planctomicrobium piriforme]SFH87515.1 hypothetical protein SAMN05421753_103308 [Planctomicrobium piriforme]